MFVAKALEDTLRRVVLLTVNRSVLLQNTVDDIREGGQFRAFRWLASPISPAVPNAAASSSPSRAQCQTDLPPLAGADHQHGRPAERADIGPRCTSSRLPSQKKIEGYRWQSFTPPAAGKSRRFRGLICHRRSQAGYRFYALYDKISREDILAHAYAQCRSNKGAPGVDGQDFTDIEAYDALGRHATISTAACTL